MNGQEVTTSQAGTNVFKQCHNHHKRKPESPDRIDDLEQILDFHHHHNQIETKNKFAGYVQDVGFDGYTIFGLSCYPGFTFYPSALSPELQRNLAYEALTEYCERPFRTNIELVPPKPSESVEKVSIWETWCNSGEEKRRYRCFQKLSWASLGYFYDWTQRCYYKDQFSIFPSALTNIGRHFAQISQLLAKRDPSYEPSACIVNYYRYDRHSAN